MILLETHHLTITLEKHRICKSLNITLRPGEILGILGPNGSGKTTLLKTLAGLQKPNGGDIYLQGKPIAKYTHQDMARQIGLLLQNTHPAFPLSVTEFCKQSHYPHPQRTHRDHKAIIEQALIDMDLIHLKDRPTHTLSGGEYKRLCIAGLLAQTPQVYLLDEVTNHLDLRHQIAVLTHFQTLAKQQPAGIILSLHNIQLAAHVCQKILMLFGNGEFLYGDTHTLLTAEYLNPLYQHPLELFTHATNTAWLPALSR